MAKIHDVKLLTTYFDDVRLGRKKAELRKNDRGYAVGDMLLLREFTGTEYTGRKLLVQITHVLQGCGYGLADGYAILSIKHVKGGKKQC